MCNVMLEPSHGCHTCSHHLNSEDAGVLLSDLLSECPLTQYPMQASEDSIPQDGAESLWRSEPGQRSLPPQASGGCRLQSSAGAVWRSGSGQDAAQERQGL